jgi:hypothetical protein
MEDLKHCLMVSWINDTEQERRHSFGFMSSKTSRHSSPTPENPRQKEVVQNKTAFELIGLAPLPTRVRGCERPVTGLDENIREDYGHDSKQAELK